MSATTGQIEWYIARDGQQHGPLTEAELDKFVEFGHLKPTDLLWRAGFAEWRPAADVFAERLHEGTAAAQVDPETPQRETAAPEASASTQSAAPAADRAAEPPGEETIAPISPDQGDQNRVAAGRGAEVRGPQARDPGVRGAGAPGPGMRGDEPSFREAGRSDVPAAANDIDDRDTHRLGGSPGRDDRQPRGADVEPAMRHGRAPGAEPAFGQGRAPGDGSRLEPGFSRAPGPAASAGRGGAASDADLRAQWAMAEARRRSGAFEEAPGEREFAEPAADLGAPPRGRGGPAPAGNDYAPPHGPAGGDLRPERGGEFDDGDFDEEDDYEYEDERGSGWLGIAATILILALIGAGGWFAYNNQAQITALYSELMGESGAGDDDIAIVRAPEAADREAASETIGAIPGARVSQPIVAAETPAEPAGENSATTAATDAAGLQDVPLLRSDAWSFAEREFSAWAEKRVEKVREMAAANASAAEINGHLVEAFVKFRRDNAALALLASSERLEQIASAFVKSLEALTTRSAESCYAFISSGEGTAALAPAYFEPSIGGKLEMQMLAIMTAVVDARNKPHARQPPRAEDFEKLSGELSQRGWSDADLKLFSNPDALSQAEPRTVCRLVTEWFATQTTLADAEARDRLIAASLRPVIGG